MVAILTLANKSSKHVDTGAVYSAACRDRSVFTFINVFASWWRRQVVDAPHRFRGAAVAIKIQAFVDVFTNGTSIWLIRTIRKARITTPAVVSATLVDQRARWRPAVFV